MTRQLQDVSHRPKGVIGETIKGFKIIRLLGRGGVGEVWMAEQRIVKTRVAIKLLREDASTDQQQIRRLFNEATVAGKICHAGVVKIFDVGFHAGRAFLVMELLEGETLTSLLQRTGRLPPDDVAELGCQIVSVLEATHAQNIIHRDLKPDNVFLVPDSELRARVRVKILDFGIAKLGTKQTATGESMGTPGYMAPEQWSHAAEADARTDVYALGCLAFELCCGRPPFIAKSIPLLYAQQINDPPPRAGSLVPDLSSELDVLIMHMLAKSPVDRPSVGDVGAVFRRLAASRSRPPELTPVGSPVSTTAATITLSRRSQRIERMPRSRRVMTVAISAAMLGIGLFVTTCNDYLTETSAPPRACPLGMVEIPAGAFQMGSPIGTGVANQHPQHMVTLSTYCIDRTEVTIRAYTACVSAGGCQPTPHTRNLLDGTESTFWSRYCNTEDRPDHPINCVDWSQAVTYCTWAGKRLPTEAEWEYAARGNDGRLYPWGNAPPNALLLNACGRECVAMGQREISPDFEKIYGAMYPASDGWETTAPVGSFPAGASPFGVLDMAGNVWEWTADWYGKYAAAATINPHGPDAGTKRVTRGGGWLSGASPGEVRPMLRAPDDPRQRRVRLGFRCARD